MTSASDGEAPLRPSGARGPRPAHSKDAVAAAAIALADAGGLQRVAMRTTAERLGTSASALYRYVASRDELVALMADAALDDLVLPELDARPVDALVQVARAQLDLIGLHPWLPEAAGRGTVLGPRALAHFETCLAILAPLPCGTAARFEAIAMLTGMATLFARSGGDAAGDPARLLAGTDPRTHPHLVAELTTPSGVPAADDLFDRTVRGVLVAVLER